MKLLSVLLIFTFSCFGQANKTLNDSIFIKGDVINIPGVNYFCGPQQLKSINPIGEFLFQNKNVVFEIGCHTDSRGSERANKKLSEERSETFYEYLISKFDLDTSKVKWKGYGESNPIYSTDTIQASKTETEKEKMHAANRRTELTVLEVPVVIVNRVKVGSQGTDTIRTYHDFAMTKIAWEFEIDKETQKENGYWKEFDVNGKMIKHIQYNQGMMWNIYLLTDLKGQKIVDVGTLKGGNGTVNFYVDKFFPSIEIYKNGLHHGLWIVYYSSGMIHTKGYYNNGKKCGTWYTFADNAENSIVHTKEHKLSCE